MNTTLTVADPLADQAVSIVITLPASAQPREARPSLISVGVAGQMPVIKTGVFGDLPVLIHEAWIAFGVRAQAAEAAAESKAVADAQLVATATTDDESIPTAQPSLATPKPQAENLSLF